VLTIKSIVMFVVAALLEIGGLAGLARRP